MNYSGRLRKLRGLVGKQGVQAFLITNESNIFYLTGFRAPGCLCVITRKHALLYVSRLFEAQARSVVHKRFKLRVINSEKKEELFSFLKNQRVGRVGFEPSAPFRFYQSMKKGLKGSSVVALSGLVEQLRIIKEPEELNLIRKSAQIACKVHKGIARFVQPGRTEREVAGLIELSMIRRGAQGTSFPVIVASQRHSFYPHHNPGSGRIKKAGVVLIDMGCLYRGYASDLTRPVFMGKISKQWEWLYRLVTRAQREAISRIKPGVPAKDVDLICRRVFSQAHMDKYFIHNTGHGLGIDVHEAPTLSPQSKEILREGMVVTVEPGLYIPGFGGLRVEDMVLLTASGAQVLTEE